MSHTKILLELRQRVDCLALKGHEHDHFQHLLNCIINYKGDFPRKNPFDLSDSEYDQGSSDDDKDPSGEGLHSGVSRKVPGDNLGHRPDGPVDGVNKSGYDSDSSTSSENSDDSTSSESSDDNGNPIDGNIGHRPDRPLDGVNKGDERTDHKKAQLPDGNLGHGIDCRLGDVNNVPSESGDADSESGDADSESSDADSESSDDSCNLGHGPDPPLEGDERTDYKRAQLPGGNLGHGIDCRLGSENNVPSKQPVRGRGRPIQTSMGSLVGLVRYLINKHISSGTFPLYHNLLSIMDAYLTVDKVKSTKKSLTERIAVHSFQLQDATTNAQYKLLFLIHLISEFFTITDLKKPAPTSRKRNQNNESNSDGKFMAEFMPKAVQIAGKLDQLAAKVDQNKSELDKLVTMVGQVLKRARHTQS